MPKFVKLVEVGPRDGLQNESKLIPTAIKIEFINLLSQSGLSTIEVTSFVSPRWVPQLADSKQVYNAINKKNGVCYPVLVPNVKGLENALEAGVREIAVFTTSSEAFCKKNINMTLAESLKNIADVIQIAIQHKIKVRAYLSCVLGCPYEGEIKTSQVADLASQLVAMGCYEISLGDTIGIGTPLKVKALLENVKQKMSPEKIAVHFHDTYGQALVNIYAALQCGIQIIDSSVAGLGGCPYAKGASGNVATEDVLYMLNGMGIETHVDMQKLLKAGSFIMKHLTHPMQSKVSRAMK